MPPLISISNFYCKAVIPNLGQVQYQASIPAAFTTGFVEAIAVSADGSTVAVARIASPNLRNGVAVYSKVADTWVADTVPIATPITLGSGNYGISLAISGDGNVLAVGANQYNSSSGAVVIFRRTGTVWVQSEMILPPTYAANLGLGTRLMLSSDGNMLVASGAPQTGAQYDSYTFIYSGGTWTCTHKLYTTPYTVAAAMSADGSMMCWSRGVTSPATYPNYEIQCYTSNSGVWTASQIIPTQGVALTGFAHALALSGNGNILYVSAIKSDIGGTDLGACYMYERLGSTWSYLGMLAGASYSFGTRIKTNYDGTWLAVGEGLKVAIYSRTGGTLTFVTRVLNNTGYADSRFGQTFGIDSAGQILAVCSKYSTEIFAA